MAVVRSFLAAEARLCSSQPWSRNTRTTAAGLGLALRSFRKGNSYNFPLNYSRIAINAARYAFSGMAIAKHSSAHMGLLNQDKDSSLRSTCIMG